MLWRIEGRFAVAGRAFWAGSDMAKSKDGEGVLQRQLAVVKGRIEKKEICEVEEQLCWPRRIVNKP